MVSAPQVILVVGGQYGSEGKGSFTHWYGQKEHVRVWGRAGGSQAGHSVNLGHRIVKLRQLPVGALIPGTASVLGPGAIIDPDLLTKEIDMVEEINGEPPFVVVDPLATRLHPGASEREHIGGLIERIGSTGEGVGAARATRIWRDADTMGSQDQGRWILQPAGEYWQGLDFGTKVIVEGTQGAALSLFGPYYPFVTSWPTHPAQLLVDMDLPVRLPHVIAVFRTFPIRVGGNSGPLFHETDWETLQARFGEHIPVEETTVTGRTRRVGEWDPVLATWAMGMIRPQEVCLSFLDYPFPEIRHQVKGNLPDAAIEAVRGFEADLEHSISWVGTGFGTYLSRWEGGW